MDLFLKGFVSIIILIVNQPEIEGNEGMLFWISNRSHEGGSRTRSVRDRKKESLLLPFHVQFFFSFRKKDLLQESDASSVLRSRGTSILTIATSTRSFRHHRIPKAHEFLPRVGFAIGYVRFDALRPDRSSVIRSHAWTRARASWTFLRREIGTRVLKWRVFLSFLRTDSLSHRFLFETKRRTRMSMLAS